MMNKIVRGKIKSIDASVGKRKGYSYEANIDTLEYIITLDDDKKYQTNCSIEDFKVDDLIDIAVFKKVKEHVKEDYENDCIILNQYTAKNILRDKMCHNADNYLLFLMSFCSTLFLTFDIISKSIFQFVPLVLLSTMFVILGHITLNTIKGIKNRESLFSEEDYVLIKKYRDGCIIKNEESADIQINKKVKAL